MAGIGHLLKDQLEVVKVKTPEGGIRYTIKPLTSELTFDKGLFVFVRAVQLLTHHNKDIIVVGLAGPSGAGKTAFSRKLQNLIPGCTLLSMDNYNDGSKVIDGNFDDPRITDYETLLANLIDLKAGKSTQSPIYDFKESRRVGYSTVEVPESRVVILEGIYALSRRLRPYLDLRVSITGGVHFDLVKRVLRDIDRSAQAPEEIIQQVSDTVYPMYKAFIEPDLKAAHLRIHNPFNPFSGFMSPTYILKSATPVSVSAIESVLGADAVKRTESETYDIYLVPPGEDPETCQSWLRMRYRDGRYNLMFEEWVVEGHFIISPRVTFEVPVRILGGLMALGYEIGTIMQRTTESFCRQDGKVTVKLDHIIGMAQCFVQIQSKDRAAVAAVGTALDLDGSYIPHSYIEVVQLENLTQSFQTVTEDLRRRFAVNGEPLIDEGQLVGSFSRGSSPAMGSFSRTIGFHMTSPSASKDASSRGGGGGRGGGRGAGTGVGIVGSQEGTSDQLLIQSSSAPIAVRLGSSLLAHSRSGLLSQKIQAAAGSGNSGGGGGLLVAGAQQNNGGHGSGGGARASSTGGSSTPDGARVSRPASPPGSADGQLRRLVQSQSLLTSQMEELTLQLSLAQQRSTTVGFYGQQSTPTRTWEQWVTPLACASGGALVGAALAALFLNGPSSRSS
ncbi:hypothetical protein Ndes2526B_g03266 [Nannochloris sp. 'desiccata']|nr:hypothetical protein KSW81_006514 [Chlorella desiccata (nom. nud.)]KAH7622439.1 putative Inorganic pyrophosphatase TTM1 [Chlorella desiccata (nom. nud.)]